MRQPEILNVNSFRGQRYVSVEKSFWSKVDIKSSDECWEWQMARSSNGYGRFTIDQTTLGAHRMAWVLVNKQSIPNGMFICHHCDNKLCCNPKHLYLGTPSDNMRDRTLRNPVPPEILGANAKLHSGEIWLIRKLNISKCKYSKRKIPITLIMKMFKISRGTIYSIWNSKEYLCKEGYYV